MAARRSGARATGGKAREREAHYRRAASTARDRLADVSAARRLYNVYDRGGADSGRHKPASYDPVRRRVLLRVYMHVDVHADVHGAAAGTHAVRDAYARGRGTRAIIVRTGRGFTFLRLVAQQMRTRMDHGLPSLPKWAVIIPHAGGTTRLGSLWRMGSSRILYDGALCARARVLGAARCQSMEISLEVSGVTRTRITHSYSKEVNSRSAAINSIDKAPYIVKLFIVFARAINESRLSPFWSFFLWLHPPRPIITRKAPRSRGQVVTMADKFVVHKFGGTSVGSADCFAKVADIVSGNEAPRMAVVVSAIGGKPKVTDLLISLLELAKQRRTAECDEILATLRKKHHDVVSTLLPAEVGEPIEKAIERDLQSVSELLRSISIMQAYNENVVEFISGHGEIWSAKILTAVLSQKMQDDGKKHRFQFVDARDFLTVEPDNEHGPVVQYDLSEQKLNAILKNGEGDELTHVVITGFICSTVEGVMTTLKRDGSDFTASICGRVLHASSVTIWTDVSGVLSADPRRVPESQILPEISYQEAMELAYFGAKVIHPKTMAPAIVEDIPIYIRNTFEPEHPGTKISDRKKVELKRTMSNGTPTARNIVSGFSTVDDLALFNIEGSGMVGVHGTSSRLFSALDRVKVNVVLIAQASSEHSICFAVPMDCAEVAKEVINETFFKEIHVGHIDKTEYIAPISIIAAVGDQMNQTPGVCARFFGALGRAKINVLAISQGSSERNISAVVHYKDSAAALRAVHSSFFLSDQTLSIGLMGLEFDEDETNSIGVALLKQYHQQREYLKQRFNVDIRVRAIGTHITSQMLLDVDGDITEEALAARKDEFVPFDRNKFLDHVCADHLPHWLIVDVSNSSHHVKDLYPQWLARKVHVMTSNINVSSASTEQHNAMQEMAIQNELTYDPEATLAIGVPIFNTIQNFIQTGDDIQRVEYSGSRFLHAVFDAVFALPEPAEADLGAIMKDLMDQYKNEFSVRDIVDDVMGVRSAKKAIMIAREMGYDIEMKDANIESPWDPSATVAGSQDEVGAWSYDYLLEHLVKASEPLKQQIAKTVADPKQALQLRQMSYIDAATGKISVRVEALPPTHSFASLKCRQGGFAFYTLRHSLHPVVVTGPIADCSITAGSLFGSTLFLARNCGARAHNCDHRCQINNKK